MIEHDDQTGLVAAFEQRFGNLAVDLAGLHEVESMPVCIKDIASMEDLITIDRDIALAVVGDGQLSEAARQISSRASEIFETMIKVFDERAVSPFAAITGFTAGEAFGEVTNGKFHYVTGFGVINPASNNQLLFTADHYLSYWPKAGCFTQLRSGIYMPRPGIEAVLDGIERHFRKGNMFEQPNRPLTNELA